MPGCGNDGEPTELSGPGQTKLLTHMTDAMTWLQLCPPCWPFDQLGQSFHANDTWIVLLQQGTGGVWTAVVSDWLWGGSIGHHVGSRPPSIARTHLLKLCMHVYWLTHLWLLSKQSCAMQGRGSRQISKLEQAKITQPAYIPPTCDLAF